MGKYIGREPAYGMFEKQVIVGDDVTTEFLLNFQVGSAGSILVVLGGVIQQPGTSYTLGVGGESIVFSFAPETGEELYIIYMGKELSVPTSVATEYTDYTPSVETFGDMEFDTLDIQQGEYANDGKEIDLRIALSLNLTGTPDNKVRISLPVNNSGDSNVSGSVTIFTDTGMETGIIRWGGVDSIDIYRQFGVDFTLGVWNFEINLEYEPEPV